MKSIFQNDAQPLREHWVYILELKNGSFYTGYARNISKRLRQHLKGPLGSRLVRAMGLKCVKQAWQCSSRSGALRIEAQIKKLSRKKKEQIVAQPQILSSVLPRIEDLSGQLATVEAIIDPQILKLLNQF